MYHSCFDQGLFVWVFHLFHTLHNALDSITADTSIRQLAPLLFRWAGFRVFGHNAQEDFRNCRLPGGETLFHSRGELLNELTQFLEFTL